MDSSVNVAVKSHHRTIGRLGLLLVTLLAGPSSEAAAQTDEAASALFRRIGLSRVAPTAAPDFNLAQVNGSRLTLSGYRGNIVFLNFWASWCGPCRKEMPAMERLHRTLAGEGLAMVAINQKESAGTVAKFIRKYSLSFPAPLDADGQVSRAFRVFGLPTTYLIDGEGRIVGKASGPREWDSADAITLLRQILSSRSGQGSGGMVALEPLASLPSVLKVRRNNQVLLSQQSESAPVIGSVAHGEELVPVGKMTNANETWYLVQANNGVTGWIKSDDVVEVRAGR